MTDYEPLVRQAIDVAARARRDGNHPFGALLVGPDGEVLLESGNTVVTERDPTGHAETNLVRLAGRAYDRKFLAGCTLVSSTEPCAMCAGAIYWSGIGTLVFGLSEKGLHAITGADPENPTLDLPSREVLAAGQRSVTVIGPLLEEEAAAVHDGFWDGGTA